MSSSLFFESLSYAAPLLFVGLQVSNLVTAYGIWKTKSVGSLSVVPFYTLFVNCTVWCIYGILVNAPPIYLPNTSGTLVGCLCTCIYQVMSPQINKQMYIAGFTIILVAFGAALSGCDSFVGTLGSCFSMALMASPLAVLRTVIKQRSTAALPFWSSAIMWLAAISWTLYGWLVINDPLVYIPNVLGFILSSVQLSLFGLYGFEPLSSSALPK